jgi:hypothetical protein
MYPHQKLISDNKINVNQLDSDTQDAIKDFSLAIRSIKMLEGRGKNTANAEAKLARLDRWLCGDILDYIDSIKGIDSDRNKGIEADDVVDDLEDAIDVAENTNKQNINQNQPPVIEERKNSGWGLGFLNW